jgi:hypothetical protein
MSISEMKRFIAENIERIEDPAKLEAIVHLIESQDEPGSDMKAFFEGAVSRYGDVLKKLAE